MTRAAILLALIAALALAAPGEARADGSDRIRAEIQAGLPADLQAVEVRAPSALAAAAGRKDGAVAVAWTRPARAGWLTLRVTAGDRSGWVRARVTALVPTVVAARDLAAGHVIAEEDVRLEMVATSAGAGAAAVGLEGAIGRAVRRPVGAGAPLPAGALAPAAPFPRGHQVTAQVRRGRLSITAAGLLERPAAVGQATSVRLRATSRVVHGRLIDPHTVLVEVSP